MDERKGGFTLIEILVVVVISAILSTVAITYSSVSRNEVSLSVETAKVQETILRAKQLAIASRSSVPGTCAFGVAFGSSTYSIFAYVPSSTPSGPAPCPSPSTLKAIASSEIVRYSNGTWQVPLANGVKFLTGETDGLSVVLFYPPAPATFLSSNGSSFLDPATALKVYLSTSNDSDSSTITVNPGGQVSI